jgi:hypothetical protein
MMGVWLNIAKNRSLNGFDQNTFVAYYLAMAWVRRINFICPLRDEGGEYAQRLISAKVNCEFRYAGDLPHGFLRMRAWSLSAEREFQAMCASLKRACLIL